MNLVNIYGHIFLSNLFEQKYLFPRLEFKWNARSLLLNSRISNCFNAVRILELLSWAKSSQNRRKCKIISKLVNLFSFQLQIFVIMKSTGSSLFITFRRILECWLWWWRNAIENFICKQRGKYRSRKIIICQVSDCDFIRVLVWFRSNLTGSTY